MLLEQGILGKCLSRSTRNRCLNHLFSVFDQVIVRANSLRYAVDVGKRKPVWGAKTSNPTSKDFRFTDQFPSLILDCYNHGNRTFVGELLAFTHSLAANLFKSTVVYEGPSNLALVDNHGSLAVEFKDVAILDQDNVLFAVAQMVLNKLFVPKQHSVLAVNRHHKFRTHRFCHDA